MEKTFVCPECGSDSLHQVVSYTTTDEWRVEYIDDDGMLHLGNTGTFDGDDGIYVWECEHNHKFDPYSVFGDNFKYDYW